MSEHRLIEAMQRETAARLSQLEHETEMSLREIAAGVEVELEQAGEVLRSRAEGQLRTYQRERLAQAENQWMVRQRTLEFQLAGQVLGEVAARLESLRRSAEYVEAWPDLFDEALLIYRQEYSAAPLLRIVPEDVPLAVNRTAAVASVETDPSLGGGVELVSPDRRLRVSNTLPARLQRGREQFLRMIAEAFTERLHG